MATRLRCFRPLVNGKNVLYGTKMMFADFTSPCTRREARRNSRREAILDVAKASFMEHGYAATTMSRIAEILGGSKGTLWSYFPSKDLLFTAVVERAAGEFRAQLSPILNPEDDVAEVLLRFAREFLQKMTSPQALALYRMVVGETSRSPEIGRIFYEQAAGRTRQLLADYLAAVMDRGALTRAEPLIIASQLLGLCIYGYHQKLLLGLVDQVDQARINLDTQSGVTAFMRAYGV